MLARADCGLVLTEPDSTSTLDQALKSLPGAQKLFIEAGYAGESCRRESRHRGCAGSARLYLFHLRFDW